MPRHRSLSPRLRLQIYLTEQNMAKLQLAAFSATKGKPAHGALSDLVNAALDQFFQPRKEASDVQPGSNEQT